ncbi:carboxylesterase/lipase family protein [Herbiconiux sp. VKM Ac-2851]|uniref:carboxylesterase/lipase family protein n=1 Tax=Herbiconiux sp. VKM Ac-2851 TaxID=2739025 RepID=UPI001567A2F0|nr:carboxylesterase/lipase family protein [Herbiconiux sp. VKM Ac-2851]NQX36477.1 carboxylesterase/lipase family protein [Herbiconiux sp. VKM Ac-2851]
MTHLTGDPLLVETESGAVRGTLRRAVRAWRGIPYAAPPVGPLRFRAPAPVEPWDGVREALDFGPAAVQHENKAVSLPEGVTQSEDCLTLNVLAPPRESDGPFPVMVWIHGGAYVAGSSAQPLFDGTELVANGDVIVVSLNYRLGALGFLDFSMLNAEGTEDSEDAEGTEPFETNVALRDQLAALAWVQRNVAAFGGDPGNVTLFGESAGAGCVTTLLTSPAAEGLFHRAIAESSPATSVYDRERAARVSHRFLGLLGLDPDASTTAAELRTIDADRLARATFDLVAAVAAEQPGTLAVAPVVDGELVPEHPVDAYRAGRQLPVPLIIGTNHDEASLFRLMKSPLMPITATSVHVMFEELAAEHPEFAAAENRIEAAYPRFPHHRTPAELSRDAGFRMPSIWLAAAHSRVAPTWMYRFDHSTPALTLLGIGATHGAEIAYVFGTLGIGRRDPSFRLGGLAEARHLSEAVQRRWLSFASEGEPAGLGPLESAVPAPEWPRYDEERRATLLFDRGERVADDPDAAIREAWGDATISFD